MKSRTVIILWAIAIVLGITAYAVKFHGSEDSETQTKLAPGDKIFSNLPIRDIASVTLTQGEDTTELVRTGEKVWGVSQRANYAPNYEQLRNLLGALGELEVKQGYPTDEKNHARFGLLEKSETPIERGLRVVLKAKDGSTIADIMLGKFSGTSRAAGRYFRDMNDSSGIYAVAETFPGIEATPVSWLDKDFLKVDQLASIALSAPQDPTFKPWKLSRKSAQPGKDGQFTLEGMTAKETMQLTSTTPLMNLFSYAAFLDVLDEAKATETANPDAKLKRTATLTTFDGLSYTLTFWPQKPAPKDPKAPAPDPRLPAIQPNYLLTVSANGTAISQARQKVADEKPEVAKQLNAQFAAKKKATEAKLATAKAFEGRIYQVSQSTIAPLQKKRSDFAKGPTPTATTPPVRVPALPQRPPAPVQP